MPAPPPFKIQALVGTLNSSTYVPIVVSGNWNNLVISNKNGANALVLRTDENDATTECAVAVGDDFSIAVVLTEQLQRVYRSRFRDGETVGYLKTTGGTGTGTVLIWG